MVPVHTLGWFYSVFWIFVLSSLFAFIYMGARGDTACCAMSLLAWAAFVTAVSAAAYLYLLRNPVPEERTVAGIARAVYNTLRELQVTDDASTLKTKLGYDKGVEVALYGKGAKEFAEAMEELLSRPINPRYIILYDVSGPVYGIPIISQVFNAVAEFAGITKQYFAVPSYFSANKERMERFARQWSIHVGGGRFVYTRSEEGSKMLSELVYSSISGWVADVSSRVYWNYFGGEEERRGRFA